MALDDLYSVDGFELHSDDFDGFFSHSLRFYYEAAAALRINARVKAFKHLTAYGIGIAALWIVPKLAGPKAIAVVLIAAATIYWLFTHPRFKTQAYAVDFTKIQQEVMDEIVRFITPEWSYSSTPPQMDRDFIESGLFPGAFDFIRESHCVSGVIQGRALVTVALNAGYYVEETVGSGKNRRKVKVPKTVFNGILISVEMPKPFQGRVCVHRDHYEKTFGWLANEFRKLGDQQLVRLEDPQFEHLFRVRATDPVLAHYILSSTRMQRLVHLNTRLSSQQGAPFVVSFKDSAMYFALPLQCSPFSLPSDPEQWQNSARRDAALILTIREIVQRVAGLSGPSEQEVA